MKNNNLFEHAILNKLARTNSLFAIRLYIVISIGVLIYGIIEFHSGVIQELFFLLLGLLIFTFIEYIFHRAIYHSGKDYLDEKNWQYKIHGVHHLHPKEKDLLAMPVPLAIFISSVLFILFSILFKNLVYFIFPGFLLGYSLYLFIHYKIHTSRPPKNVFKYLWKHHHIHHHLHDNKAFGLSSPLWDIIFGTMPPKRLQKNK